MMGLASGKNFIRENAVTAITTETKKLPTRDINFLEKPGFGQTPAYLGKVKVSLLCSPPSCRQRVILIMM
jgi:hypothetical protein